MQTHRQPVTNYHLLKVMMTMLLMLLLVLLYYYWYSYIYDNCWIATFLQARNKLSARWEKQKHLTVKTYWEVSSQALLVARCQPTVPSDLLGSTDCKQTMLHDLFCSHSYGLSAFFMWFFNKILLIYKMATTDDYMVFEGKTINHYAREVVPDLYITMLNWARFNVPPHTL